MVDYTDAGAISEGLPETFWYLYDERGSVVAITDDAGIVVEQYRYDPYGGATVYDGSGAVIATWTDPNSWDDRALTPSAIGNPYGFTGHRFSVAGLYETPFRAYSPELGRWLQRDPLGYVDGMNLYQYVLSNPMYWYDPYGLVIDTVFDVASLAYDVARVVKNTAETAYNVARVAKNHLEGDVYGRDHALDSLDHDLRELRGAVIDTGLDAVGTAIPGVTGLSKADDVVRAADNVDDLVDAARAGGKLDNAADAVKSCPIRGPVRSNTGKTIEELVKEAQEKYDKLAGKLITITSSRSILVETPRGQPCRLTLRTIN